MSDTSVPDSVEVVDQSLATVGTRFVRTAAMTSEYSANTPTTFPGKRLCLVEGTGDG